MGLLFIKSGWQSVLSTVNIHTGECPHTRCHGKDRKTWRRRNCELCRVQDSVPELDAALTSSETSRTPGHSASALAEPADGLRGTERVTRPHLTHETRRRVRTGTQRAQRSAQPLPILWEARQHPITLALETKQGHFRTHFPKAVRTCPLPGRADAPRARWSPQWLPTPQLLATSHRTWAERGKLPLQIAGISEKGAVATYKHPTAPLASKAIGKQVPRQQRCGGRAKGKPSPSPHRCGWGAGQRAGLGDPRGLGSQAPTDDKRNETGHALQTAKRTVKAPTFMLPCVTQRSSVSVLRHEDSYRT